MDRDLIKALAWFAVLILLIAAGVWMRFFAPCGQLGWVPLKELPARCLAVH